MNTPFPFDGMLVFAFLSLLLLIGVVLRAKVAFFQRFLVPSCLIGGCLGLACLHLDLLDIQPASLEIFAYHFFNMSFISVGLTRSESKLDHRGKPRSLKGPAWMALMQGLTFPMQAVAGGLLVIILGWFGLQLFPTFGFLVPLGFNEGPGQALSIGKVWEGAGFADAATIGLTFAALGYFCAFFIGVPLVSRGIRRGRATLTRQALPREFMVGILDPAGQPESAGRLTLHAGNIETLAFQAALVGAVYGLTYAIITLLGSWLPADAAKILWGFFFFFGLGVALIVKWIMQRLNFVHLVDSGIQRRITGWSVDYLIVATAAAIELTIVRVYIVPIGIIALVNAVLTTLLVVRCGRRLSAFSLERTAALYGVVTGTVSCGLLLLRMVDPEFKTPVAYEIAVMNVFALPVIGGCTVLVNGPLWWNWSLWTTIGVFAAIIVVNLIVMRLMGLLNGAADSKPTEAVPE
jgi:ESS family glutamate:Na+ symporter